MESKTISRDLKSIHFKYKTIKYFKKKLNYKIFHEKFKLVFLDPRFFLFLLVLFYSFVKIFVFLFFCLFDLFLFSVEDSSQRSNAINGFNRTKRNSSFPFPSFFISPLVLIHLRLAQILSNLLIEF